jgi:acyl dehydratase
MSSFRMARAEALYTAEEVLPMVEHAMYLDDLYVGQRFTSDTYRMQEADIVAFAANFDPQPFHLDRRAAESSVFKGLTASGWHTASVAMRLLVTGGLPLAEGIVGLGGDIAWPKPTRPGDLVHVESEITEITPSRSNPDRAIVKVRGTMLNQDREAVYVLNARVLVSRRPAS